MRRSCASVFALALDISTVPLTRAVARRPARRAMSRNAATRRLTLMSIHLEGPPYPAAIAAVLRRSARCSPHTPTYAAPEAAAAAYVGVWGLQRADLLS